MTIPRAPILWGGIALVVLAAVLVLLGTQSNEGQLNARSLPGNPIRQSVDRPAPGPDNATRLMVESFANQPSAPASRDSETKSALLPVEWEQPLFDILMDQEQGMERRNKRLLELATGAAKGVPAVQQECVMHLLFGLSDDNGAQFLAVATNTTIPVAMRAEFLKQALEMRPQELGEWLGQQVSNHYEPEISAIGRLYLLDLRGAQGN